MCHFPVLCFETEKYLCASGATQPTPYMPGHPPCGQVQPSRTPCLQGRGRTGGPGTGGLPGGLGSAVLGPVGSVGLVTGLGQPAPAPRQPVPPPCQPATPTQPVGPPCPRRPSWPSRFCMHTASSMPKSSMEGTRPFHRQGIPFFFVLPILKSLLFQYLYVRRFSRRERYAHCFCLWPHGASPLSNDGRDKQPISRRAESAKYRNSKIAPSPLPYHHHHPWRGHRLPAWSAGGGPGARLRTAPRGRAGPCGAARRGAY